MSRILREYESLLQSVDEWFGAVRSKYSGRMQCGLGCAMCCRGLFDISLPDAVIVARGFSALSESLRSAVLARASVLQARIKKECPELDEPYFLNADFQDRIDELVNRMVEARCPFLDEADSCLIYDHRPMACRMEGVPMADTRDGLFGDWCELNFTDGVSPDQQKDLSLDYYGMQDVETGTAQSLARHLPGCTGQDATVFIPSVIAAYYSFWSCLQSRP